jgi:hypothetical protein
VSTLLGLIAARAQTSACPVPPSRPKTQCPKAGRVPPTDSKAVRASGFHKAGYRACSLRWRGSRRRCSACRELAYDLSVVGAPPRRFESSGVGLVRGRLGRARPTLRTGAASANPPLARRSSVCSNSGHAGSARLLHAVVIGSAAGLMFGLALDLPHGRHDAGDCGHELGRWRATDPARAPNEPLFTKGLRAVWSEDGDGPH